MLGEGRLGPDGGCLINQFEFTPYMHQGSSGLPHTALVCEILLKMFVCQAVEDVNVRLCLALGLALGGCSTNPDFCPFPCAFTLFS